LIFYVFTVNKRNNYLRGDKNIAARNSYNNDGAISVLSNPNSNKKRIFDGTSEKELMKAMSTYLNQTGAGDYNLPNLTGEKVHIAGIKSNPNWTFQSRTKLSWFPSRHVDF
jgi:hypothetical protein